MVYAGTSEAATQSPALESYQHKSAACTAGEATRDPQGGTAHCGLEGNIAAGPTGRWDDSGALDSEEGSDCEEELLPLHERLRLRRLEVSCESVH